MTFPISAPSTMQSYDRNSPVVWKQEHGSCFVSESSGILTLYKGEYRLATLINGYDTLNSKYKGDFNKWIKAVKRKDLEKVDRVRANMKQVEEQCNIIETIWTLP